ncbi:30S ribosomal protein S18 [Candidatus Uhrbacteria bacterium CG10_big_fil_rev_8_21_14_0_10_48_16]|uniref:Small ribosomal subunit protein bS18 n=1 Tax=Candidatus Uhrbacteria bacterium CG10_big_fil_rev_8_21_14_0_10_48_16 TaxID=1975038 RepID=A0A2M8LI47_9BACT|nr:MAG: 30S ribosomal protein S18 [Candidatus Uhrbacteria bacterium CG10_big_fil_rev_8_21_14_0_10_48_16]
MPKPNPVVNKQKQCYFCFNNIHQVDYKDVTILRRFLSSFAKIVARKRSKVCMTHQRQLTSAIKRARIMALLPFVQR